MGIICKQYIDYNILNSMGSWKGEGLRKRNNQVLSERLSVHNWQSLFSVHNWLSYVWGYLQRPRKGPAYWFMQYLSISLYLIASAQMYLSKKCVQSIYSLFKCLENQFCAGILTYSRRWPLMVLLECRIYVWLVWGEIQIWSPRI
jgi:hypothetical protein